MWFIKWVTLLICFSLVGIACVGGGPVIAETVTSELSPVGETIYNSEVPVMSEVENSCGIIKFKEFPIGDWNMDTDPQKDVVTGIDRTKVKTLSAMIVNDTQTSYQDFYMNTGGTGTHGLQAGVSKVTLYRATDGIYDTVSYDSLGFNRGSVIVGYVD